MTLFGGGEKQRGRHSLCPPLLRLSFLAPLPTLLIKYSAIDKIYLIYSDKIYLIYSEETKLSSSPSLFFGTAPRSEPMKLRKELQPTKVTS